MIEESKIIKALGKVIDPKTGQNLILANMIKDLKIEGQNVNFTLILAGHDGQTKFNLNAAAVQAVQTVYPDSAVNVHMFTNADGAAPKSKPLPHVQNIIAVASGKGGVGKSTVSVNLAMGLLQQGYKVGLIDADLYGPSIPKMLGLENQRPRIQDSSGTPKIIPLEAHGLFVMSMGFIIEPQQAVVLRGPRLGGIIKQFFMDVIWPPLDYIIVDLPPGTGDIQLTLVQTVPVTGAIMVTTPQDVAIADAVKAMNMFLLPNINVPIVGVIENMSWFTPKELPNNKYHIFGSGGGASLAKEAKSTLLGQVPLVQGIRESGDSGNPAILMDDPIVSNAFKSIAEKAVVSIVNRNKQAPPTEQVEITTR